MKTRKKPAHIGIGGSFQGVVAGLDLNLNLMTLRDRWNSITGVVVFLSPKAIYHWEQELVILASSRRRIWWQTEPIHSDIPNILVGLSVLEDFFRKKSTPPSSSQEKLGEKKGDQRGCSIVPGFYMLIRACPRFGLSNSGFKISVCQVFVQRPTRRIYRDFSWILMGHYGKR